jgi:hypothetical protein
LADFFGREGTFNPNNPATAFMVAGAVARMAGAGAAASTDPAAWLRGRGYAVPAGGMHNATNNQTAIFMVMALYEMKTNTRISSLRITNFSHTAGMAGIDQRFLRSIQAAFELEIVTETFNPNAAPTVGDVLRMLEALDRKIGL